MAKSNSNAGVPALNSDKHMFDTVTDSIKNGIGVLDMGLSGAYHAAGAFQSVACATHIHMHKVKYDAAADMSDEYADLGIDFESTFGFAAPKRKDK